MFILQNSANSETQPEMSLLSPEKSHESALSQTTREVQKRSVCFDFELESSDDEDLSASFLSCAVSPSPSSIVSNKEENQVEIDAISQDLSDTVERNRTVQVRVF